MKFMTAYLQKLREIQSQRGFTMIELLIVISILGILAVAVLSAINPIEQINRGRDTGSRSDAEQLLSATERFNAFQGYYPWQENANDVTGIPQAINPVDDTWIVPAVAGCTVLQRLSIGDENIVGCVASQELKESFVDRLLTSAASRQLYVYNRGQQGDSTYVCFVPQSGAFITEAETRCAAGLPLDLLPEVNNICNGAG
ncbi:MAG: hypothetical protein QG639_809, partial [Patescibacteria group bacterium]|nr:hypothetical protein [Patescibacteria group bacterium]